MHLNIIFIQISTQFNNNNTINLSTGHNQINFVLVLIFGQINSERQLIAKVER